MDYDTAEKAFMAAIDTYCKGLDWVSVGCRGKQCEYADGAPDHSCEASFSWVQCDSCGSSLGGDRLPATGGWTAKDGTIETIDLDICVDCAMFHANGDTPET